MLVVMIYAETNKAARPTKSAAPAPTWVRRAALDALEEVEAAAAPVVEAEVAADAVPEAVPVEEPEPEDGATEESWREEIGSPEVSQALVYSVIHCDPRWLETSRKKTKGYIYSRSTMLCSWP